MKPTSRLLFKDSSSYPGGQILSANRSAARGATASLLKYSAAGALSICITNCGLNEAAGI
jgi:hypothetical protein